MKSLLWMFLGLIVAWVVVGGPERDFARSGVFLKPLAPLDSGTPYGGSYIYETADLGKAKIEKPSSAINTGILSDSVDAISKKLKEAEAITVPSLFLKTLVIDGVAGARATTPNSEYIRLIAPEKNRRDIEVSGLILKSAITEVPVSIPFAIKTFISGQKTVTEPIVLAPGQSVLVATGYSPVGVSFKENICTGYLGQFQTFTPELRKECPDPVDELGKAGLGKDISCAAFVSQIPTCTAYTKTIPNDLSSDCKNFIQKNLTYNGCVITHERDANFHKNTWRVFLGKTKELWRAETEMIRLSNTKGDTIDALVY